MPEPYIPLVPRTLVAGRVAAIPKGEWNSTTQYVKLDIVRHGLCSYMAKKASINHVPIGEDDEYWMLLVESFVDDFIGAIASADGHSGMVPAPLAGEEHNVLRGDGDWGPKLEMDVVKQGDLYGYVNSLNEFVAFQSQEDVIRIITELLIPEDAQEALDTLEEIADWIQDHPEDAADMNRRITDLENDTFKKTGGTITGDVTIDGELEIDTPLAISSGGTGADNAHDARVNLNAFNNENVAPVETGTTASRNYAVGDHFIKDDVLYEVTGTIHSGDEFVIGNDSLRPNVLIIDQVNDATGTTTSSSSSDDGSDDSGDEPAPGSGIAISTTLTTVHFTGVGDGTERLFVICTNLLDNPLVEHDKPYTFAGDSRYVLDDNHIEPRFAIYENDELITIDSIFNLEDYPNATVVKPIYLYTITGEIDITLTPEVRVKSDFYNCSISPSIEDQIKSLNEHGVVMIGATDTEDGSAGYVPAPKKGDNKKVFKGDGTYDKVNLEDEVKNELPVANGGTGADNEIDAVKNLHAVPDTMITANVEYSSKASKPYAVSDQLIYDGTLYTVMTAISKNDLFIVGSNIVKSDDILKQIKAISVVGTRFVGATDSTDGEMGLVPKPLAGDHNKLLQGDGNWEYHSRNFVGTMPEWEALTLAEKTKYETADILPEFGVTVVKDEHVDSVTLSPVTTDDKYGYGRIVTVTATPKTGFSIASGTGDYIITDNTTITITTGVKQITLTVNKGTNVDTITVTPDPVSGTYDYGTVVTITATANEHYVITGGTGTYTLTDDLTIDVTAALEQFTVTIDADEGIDNVRLAPSAPNNVYDYGTVVTAVVTPKTGYDLISGAGQYTVNDDITITVVSEIQHYTLTVVPDANVDSVTLSPVSTRQDGKYDYGTVVTVSATADEHYDIISGAGEYTITGDTTVNVTSRLQRFTVSVYGDLEEVANIYTSVEPVESGETHYGPYYVFEYGTVVTFTADPITGYDIIPNTSQYEHGLGTYTIENSFALTIHTEIQHFTLTVNSDAHVDSVTLNPASTRQDGKYDYGTVVTVTADPITGYDIISGTGEYTITTDTTVNVVSEIQHFTLTTVGDEHVDDVTLSPVSSRPDGKYDYGTVVTVTGIPDTGYDIISGDGEYTITADTTVNLTSEIKHLSFNVSAGNGVSSVAVSPQPDANDKYDYGTVITVTAVPVTGYDIISGVGEYTITEDTSITVTADIQHLTLTISTDDYVDNVVLSPQPDANGKYDYGTAVTITATALPGYEITNNGTYTIYTDQTVVIRSQLAPVTLTNNSAFTLGVVEPGWDGTIEYAKESETIYSDDAIPQITRQWTEWDGSNISVAANDTLYLRGSGNTKLYNGSYDNRFIFTASSFVGSMEMLLDADDALAGEHPTMAVGAFRSIFEGNTNLVTPPMLPATTLAEDCYYSMFEGCTSLTSAPELPATTLADYAYAHMFYGCTALVTPPALPATTIAEGCYDSMFTNCTALTTLPVLPATTLAEDCYEEMFLNCLQIKLARDFSAEYAYEYRIPASSTGTNPGSLRRMFYNTGGTFTGTPTVNVIYYTNNEPIE